jgi:hypothetical protein
VSDLPDISTAPNTSGGLVHPDGALCKWCKDEPATTIIYGWPTGVLCAVSRRERVARYLADMNPYRSRR